MSLRVMFIWFSWQAFITLSPFWKPDCVYAWAIWTITQQFIQFKCFYIVTNNDNSHLKVLYFIRQRPHSIRKKNHKNQTILYQQLLGDSGKKELHYDVKRPPADLGLGYGVRGWRREKSSGERSKFTFVKLWARRSVIQMLVCKVQTHSFALL